MSKKNKKLNINPINSDNGNTAMRQSCPSSRDGVIQSGCMIVPTDLFPGKKIIEENEYNRLISENIDLKGRITSLYNNERKYQDELIRYREELSKNQQTINELREENAELKKKLELLENEVVIIKKENIVLKSDMKILKDNNDELKNDVSKLKNKELYKRYLIAIQDLNKFKKLEGRVKTVNRSKMETLRDDRIDISHYLVAGRDIFDKKIRVLNEKLTNMSDDIHEMFEDEYPDLIEDIIRFTVNDAVLSEDDRKKIERWWN